MRFIFILLIFIISNSAYSTHQYFLLGFENEEMVKRIQKCSSTTLTENIFIQYENSDGTLRKPDGYVYYSNNINVECVNEVFSRKESGYENASYLIKEKEFWYFYIPSLTYDDGINPAFVEVNQNMIFIDIEVGSTHTRNFIYNIKTKDTIYLNNGVATLEKDYILIEGNKSYKPKFGGAFWHSFKMNYDTEVIELIHAEKSDEPCTKGSCVLCFTEDEYLSEERWILGDNVRDYLENNKPAEWCVYD
jgi:hypothetical protein